MHALEQQKQLMHRVALIYRFIAFGDIGYSSWSDGGLAGLITYGLTKAIAPITEENKIPMVEANGASRSLFTKGYKYLFAV